MKVLILVLMSILLSIIILRLVYKKDIEKEPLKLLVGMFGLGIISCFVTAFLTGVFQNFFPRFLSENLESFNYFELFIFCFIFISTIEEFSKWIFNFNVVWNHQEFNHVYDSIVYSVFFGLGFGTFENVLYVLSEGFGIAILRALLSIPAHAFFAICMGYFIGMAKLAYYNSDRKLEKKYKVYSLIIPILLHGFYDFCLVSKSIFLIFLDFVFVVYIYIKGFKILNKLSSVKTNLK